MLTTVFATRRADGAVSIRRPHAIQREPRGERVRLLRGPEGELSGAARGDRVDQWTGRVIQPVTIRLGIPGDPRLPAIDLLGEGLEAEIPVGDVAEHARHGPVLVHGCGERLVVERLDERPQALQLTRVRFDVWAMFFHGVTLLRPY